MRRRAIGAIALVLLLGAAALWFWPQGDFDLALLAAMVRVGTVMAVLWLAYPDIQRMPAWIWAIFPVMLVIVAVRPKWIFIAVPILIALAVLKPRIRTTSRERQQNNVRQNSKKPKR